MSTWRSVQLQASVCPNRPLGIPQVHSAELCEKHCFLRAYYKKDNTRWSQFKLWVIDKSWLLKATATSWSQTCGNCCLFVIKGTLTLTLPGPSAGVSESLDSYCSLKPLCSGMGEVVPARTSPTLLPPRTSPTLLPPSPRTVLHVIILFRSVAVHQLSWLAL